MGVCGRQTDTQNTINFLPNHSIKTMKFMLSPPQKTYSDGGLRGAKKAKTLTCHKWSTEWITKGEEEVISSERQVFLGIKIREKQSSSR